MILPMRFNPYSTIVFLCGILLLGIAIFAWQRRSTIGAGIFALSMVSHSIYVLGYSMELASLNLETMLFWSQVQYLGIVTFPTLNFIFVLQFTGKENWLTRYNLIFLSIIPFIYWLLKLFDQDLHLLYASAAVDLTGPIPLLEFTRGPLYWFGPSYTLLMLVLCLVFLSRSRRHASAVFRNQSALIIIAALTPFVIFVAYFLGFSSLPFLKNLDPNPFSLAIYGIGVSWALFRYRLFDLAPIAREALVENLGDGVVVLDGLCRVVDANPAAMRIFGWKTVPIGQLSGQVFKDWVELAGFCHVHSQTMKNTVQKIELEHSQLGENQYFDVSSSSLRGKNGSLLGYLLLIHDVTDRKKAEEKLRELSLVDELTGLNNRRGFYLLASQLISMAQRMKLGVILMYADQDHLKWINDNLGHSIGDQALLETAGLLKNMFRFSDIIARIGGDEFVVLAIETAENSLDTIRARMENRLAAINQSPERRYSLSISFGFSQLVPGSSMTLEDLLAEADRAMYIQKSTKRQSAYPH